MAIGGAAGVGVAGVGVYLAGARRGSAKAGNALREAAKRTAKQGAKHAGKAGRRMTFGKGAMGVAGGLGLAAAYQHYGQRRYNGNSWLWRSSRWCSCIWS